MTPSEKVLSTFQTRVRQMILQYQEMKKENSTLLAKIAEQEQRIEQMEAQLTQCQNDYESLKMARMLTIVDKDLEGAKNRVAKMIRDVNKCITVLSDEK